MNFPRIAFAFSVLSASVLASAIAEEVNILDEGDFESQQGGMPAGFDWTGYAGDSSVTPNRFELVTEDGSQFVRLTVPPGTGKESAAVQVKESIPLPSDWTGLKVSVKLRVKEYVQGEESWNGVKVMAMFYDSNGEEIGSDLPLVSIKEDIFDWTTLEKEIQIPPGAETFKINAGFMGSSGIGDFDDLTVVPIK